MPMNEKNPETCPDQGHISAFVIIQPFIPTYGRGNEYQHQTTAQVQQYQIVSH